MRKRESRGARAALQIDPANPKSSGNRTTIECPANEQRKHTMSRRERQLKAINDFMHNNPRATPEQIEAETLASREQREAKERFRFNLLRRGAGVVVHEIVDGLQLSFASAHGVFPLLIG